MVMEAVEDVVRTCSHQLVGRRKGAADGASSPRRNASTTRLVVEATTDRLAAASNMLPLGGQTCSAGGSHLRWSARRTPDSSRSPIGRRGTSTRLAPRAASLRRE